MGVEVGARVGLGVLVGTKEGVLVGATLGAPVPLYAGLKVGVVVGATVGGNVGGVGLADVGVVLLDVGADVAAVLLAYNNFKSVFKANFFQNLPKVVNRVSVLTLS